jgi:6-hydroxy-3-succinoylpyridine 3-monooxygenase
VYIDGYNLYYGCLKKSPDKWLDVRALIERILPSILHEKKGQPVRFTFQTPAIKYFTAPILVAFAKSDDCVSCQSHYHTALHAHLGGAVEIIRGYHDAKPARAHVWEEGVVVVAMFIDWLLSFDTRFGTQMARPEVQERFRVR